MLKEDAEFLLGRAFLATQKEAAGRALLQGLIDAQPPGKLAGTAAQALAELDDSQGKSRPTRWRFGNKAITLLPNASAQAVGGGVRAGWSALAAKQPAAAQRRFFCRRATSVRGGQVLKVANTGLLRACVCAKEIHALAQGSTRATQPSDVLPGARGRRSCTIAATRTSR